MQTESPQMPLERQQSILRLAMAQRVVRIRDLAKQLEVHEMTVRRDLDALSEQGLLERVHGGARMMQQSASEVSYSLRAAQQTDAKQAIARAARRLIQPGDAIGLDASTTALALAQYLGELRVNVVVTGLDVATTLAALEVPFLLTGGNFHAPARSFTGQFVGAALARLRLDKVFFSSKGFSLERGFTDAHLPEAESKAALIGSGSTVIALIDHTKFTREAFCQVTDLERVDIIITDQSPNVETVAALKAMDVRLILASAA